MIIDHLNGSFSDNEIARFENISARPHYHHLQAEKKKKIGLIMLAGGAVLFHIFPEVASSNSVIVNQKYYRKCSL